MLCNKIFNLPLTSYMTATSIQMPFCNSDPGPGEQNDFYRERSLSSAASVSPCLALVNTLVICQMAWWVGLVRLQNTRGCPSLETRLVYWEKEQRSKESISNLAYTYEDIFHTYVGNINSSILSFDCAIIGLDLDKNMWALDGWAWRQISEGWMTAGQRSRAG